MNTNEYNSNNLETTLQCKNKLIDHQRSSPDDPRTSNETIRTSNETIRTSSYDSETSVPLRKLSDNCSSSNNRGSFDKKKVKKVLEENISEMVKIYNRKTSSTDVDEMIRHFIKEQLKKDHEILRLKKQINMLKREVETYVQYMDENVGYR